MSFPERLRAAAQRELRRTDPDAELGELTALEGGRSGVTMAGTLTTAAGAAQIVVKAAPDGRRPVGRHDVARQADVLDALAAGPVPCPRVLARVTDGVTCVVMERCAGETVEPVLDAATRRLPAGLVRERAVRAARLLAALHRTDLAGSPALHGEPPADPGAELQRWSATAAAVDGATAPRIGELEARLRATVPPAGPPTLVHGDLRLGNIVFDGPRPTGVIDWEIWGVTDPGVDLGWFLVFCDADTFPGIGSPVLGLPGADELLEVYREAGGPAVADVAWFDALGRFKMAAVMAHNLRRHREGRHVDPFQERLPPTIARLVETGIERLAGVGTG